MNPDILDKILRAIIVFLQVEKLGCTNSSWKRVTSPPIVPSSGTAGGRGGGRGRGRSGSRSRGNRQGSRATTKPRVRSTFKGNTEEMNGHVFQCFNECEDKKHFSKTVEALREYIAKKLKYPGDMVSLTKDFVRTEIPKPTELKVSETNRLVIAIWEKKVSAYCTRTDYLDSNLKTAYAVMWGQCSEAKKAKLTSLDAFETKSHESDCIWILKEIKGITYRFEVQRYIYLSLDDARTSYYAYTQGAKDSISSYLEHFRSLVKVWNTMAAPLAKTQVYWMLLPLSRPTQTTQQSASRLHVTALLLWLS